MNQQKQDVWISGKTALAILKGNSGRDDIPESYVRTLAFKGKVAKRQVGKGENEYLLSDIENYVVKRRNQRKGDTRQARAAGSRRKHIAEAG